LRSAGSGGPTSSTTANARQTAEIGRVAWLTEGTVAAYGRKRLPPIGDDKWAFAFIFSRIQGSNA